MDTQPRPFAVTLKSGLRGSFSVEPNSVKSRRLN